MVQSDFWFVNVENEKASGEKIFKEITTPKQSTHPTYWLVAVSQFAAIRNPFNFISLWNLLLCLVFRASDFIFDIWFKHFIFALHLIISFRILFCLSSGKENRYGIEMKLKTFHFQGNEVCEMITKRKKSVFLFFSPALYRYRQRVNAHCKTC